MTPQQLGQRVASSQKLSETTLEIWSYTLNYIFEHGWTDITDTAFIRTATRQFRINSRTLMAHLRRMARLGLLKRFRLVEDSDFSFLSENKSPRIFIRYTLPGMHAQSMDSRIESPLLQHRGHDLTAAEERNYARIFATPARKAPPPGTDH